MLPKFRVPSFVLWLVLLLGTWSIAIWSGQRRQQRRRAAPRAYKLLASIPWPLLRQPARAGE